MLPGELFVAVTVLVWSLWEYRKRMNGSVKQIPLSKENRLLRECNADLRARNKLLTTLDERRREGEGGPTHE